MNANALTLGLSLATVLLGAASALPAQAATAQNINTHGSACRNYNAGEALDIDYLSYGVRTIASGARSVICPLPRHPVTGPGQNFYVDGSNASGATTSCTVYAYDYNGTFLSSATFSRSDATYTNYVSLPSVSYWGYVSVLCTLPASGGGVLFGASAIDN